MSPAPRRVLFLAAVLLLQPGRSGALGPSNLDLVSRAATRAVQEAVAGLDTAGHGEGFEKVSLQPAAKDDANWLFEHLLLEELLTRGLAVTADTSAAAAHLSYRVIEVAVTGRSGLLTNNVTRRCRVGLQLDLDMGGERLWSGEGRAGLRDRIPKGELDALQQSRFDFAETDMEKRTWGKYVEPAIVSSVLGSLVYLFYSNR